MANATVNIITDSLTRLGLTNPYVQQGIVGVIGEESGYVPKSEISYRNTPASRLRLIFGDRLKNYTDAQLDQLKLNDVTFFDIIYGGRYGNTSVGDGYKYRGRGFNQITFKSLYQKYGNMIGVDLVNNPDLLNDVSVAAKAAAAYFIDTINSAKSSGQLYTKFQISDLSQVKDVGTGAKIALQANAGFGTNTNTSFFQSVFDKVIANAKANPVKSGIIGSVILVAFVTFVVVLNTKA